MDALTIPAVGGVDSTAVIIGDFSNGNDGIVMKNGETVKALKGRTINLVELSVSHYLLARALDMNGMSEQDVRLVNTSDADIAALFTSDPNGTAVTWNPPLMQARNAPGAKLVFSSADIPGEIVDMMVVKSAAPDSLNKALTGAWYETLKIINTPNTEGEKALEFMANASGATLAEFKAQLKTTAMFYNAAEAIASSDGLGYRIFLVRRYLAMDIILTYVFWITLLGYFFDYLLRLLLRRFFPWYAASET